MGASGRNNPTAEDLAKILELARTTALANGAKPYEADEVAQITAIKLWQKWRQDGVRRARSWNDNRWHGYVRQVARRVHIDLIRNHQRRIARQNKAVVGHSIELGHGQRGAQVPVSPAVVEAYEARALIAEEILQLPRQQREVAARIFIEEMTAAEVSVELGIQPQSVRKHLRRAKRTLQARLTELEKLHR